MGFVRTILGKEAVQLLLVLTVISAPDGAADKTITSPAKKAERIVIVKSAHTMTLVSGGQVLKTYKVALGDPVGAKKQQGDRETPEGEYVIDSKNTHSASIVPCMSRIPIRRTGSERVNWASVPDATLKSTACLQSMPG